MQKYTCVLVLFTDEMLAIILWLLSSLIKFKKMRNDNWKQNLYYIVMETSTNLDNSKNHLVPSSLCAPEATFFIALVTDFAPVNIAYFYTNNIQGRFTIVKVRKNQH